MSVLPKMPCGTEPLDWLTLLKFFIVKDAEGNYYINLFYNECDDPCSLETALDCVSYMTPEELLKHIGTEDECGLPALAVTGNICTACES